MNLSTQYMGLRLRNPVVASSSPLSHTVEGIRRMEDAGAGAVVMFSLFEEQVSLESHYIDYYLTHGTESFSEAQTYFPQLHNYNLGPSEYLNLILRAKEAVDIPIIGSLNGISNSGWIEYARLIEEAGADGLELNVYFLPTDADMNGAEVEGRYLDILSEVKAAVSIPVAMKLNPYFSSIPHMARSLARTGADALVLFNRFYQPDFDLENLEVVPRLVLSNSHELRLPLTWIAILYGRVPVDFAVTTGIHTHTDVLKALMAGARVTMMASELLKNGVGRINQILDEMRQWMIEHEYDSVGQMIGSLSQQHVAEPTAFERANYMKMLDAYRPLN